MNGKDTNLINSLIKKMNLASKELNYEKAASFRDKIRSLEKTHHVSKIFIKILRKLIFLVLFVLMSILLLKLLFVGTAKTLDQKLIT